MIEWILDQPDCDLGTAATFFFVVGLANKDPDKLAPSPRRSWRLMKRVADNWQKGLYRRIELEPWTQRSDVKHYDALVTRREAEGRPLPWKIPGPNARRFGSRQANSPFLYEHGHLRLSFSGWTAERERWGCGRDFPRCCEPRG